MTVPLPDFNVLRVKDLENIMKVSKTTAKKLFKDIKVHFDIKIVLACHFYRYLKV